MAAWFRFPTGTSKICQLPDSLRVTFPQCKAVMSLVEGKRNGFWLANILGLHITKTYLYNFYPLKPHFYIVKLGFTGVYIIFLISAQNIDCGYSLEPPRGSNEYPQSMF